MVKFLCVLFGNDGRIGRNSKEEEKGGNTGEPTRKGLQPNGKHCNKLHEVKFIQRVFCKFQTAVNIFMDARSSCTFYVAGLAVSKKGIQT